MHLRPSFRLLFTALLLSASAAGASLACSKTTGGGTGAAGAGGTSTTSGTGGTLHGNGPVARHSSSIAVTPDGSKIYVVNADTDSVSEIDAKQRKLLREIPLGGGPPAVDANGRYTPAIAPRALAYSPTYNNLYVTGERSSSLYAIDLSTGKVVMTAHVGSEPIGVVLAPDESAAYVACSNDGTVVRVDPVAAKVTATAKITDGTSPLGYTIQAQPWALAWSLDGSTLYATHMLAPNVSAIDPTSLMVKSTMSIPDVAPRADKRQANGESRGLYDIVARPGSSGEIWTAHMMLAVLTAEPDLDFESTVFPTLSIFHTDGTFVTRLSTNAMAVPGDDGAFGDIASGPRAVEFTADGNWALMLDSASEDVMAVDANGRVEAQLLRPLYPSGGTPGHLQEGLVISPDGKHAYIDQRNTSDVAVIDIDTSSGTIALTVDGPAIPRLAAADPMPAAMRHGQFLFNTANSDLVPLTQNHWVACASCHIEGRTDAVTWRFLQGPRDTPTNSGGAAGRFLFRTADRRAVTDYWMTIVQEQGGAFDTLVDGGTPAPPTDPGLLQDLDDIQTYVNLAIPTPIPPTTDPTLVAMGQAIFESSTTQCNTCHMGPAHTDSGQDNATLDLCNGKIQLHDVGTCVTAPFPDVAHDTIDGCPRAACMFNTPSLRGVAATPPYLHDGSAATLHDVLQITKGKMGNINGLTDAQLDALVEYLRTF